MISVVLQGEEASLVGTSESFEPKSTTQRVVSTCASSPDMPIRDTEMIST